MPSKKNVFRFQVIKSAYLDMAFGVRAVLTELVEGDETYNWTQEWEYHIGDGSVYTRCNGSMDDETPEKGNYTDI